MTQVVLNIDGKKKWTALKTILEVMDIDYKAQDAQLTQTELNLLHKAESDKENRRLNIYTNHRDTLSQ